MFELHLDSYSFLIRQQFWETRSLRWALLFHPHIFHPFRGWFFPIATRKALGERKSPSFYFSFKFTHESLCHLKALSFKLNATNSQCQPLSQPSLPAPYSNTLFYSITTRQSQTFISPEQSTVSQSHILRKNNIVSELSHRLLCSI